LSPFAFPFVVGFLVVLLAMGESAGERESVAVIAWLRLARPFLVSLERRVERRVGDDDMIFACSDKCGYDYEQYGRL
jgi:hypothetical protein